MSAKYVRKCYNVPAKRGMRIVANGKRGTITGFSGAYLLVRLDGEALSWKYHPNCKHCGAAIIRTNDPFQTEWMHYRADFSCGQPEPWPAELPWETTLSDGDGDLG